MGATSWHFFTPYQLDAEAALQTVRAEVFARGAYSDPAGAPEEHVRRMYWSLGMADSAECRAAMEELQRDQRYLASGDEQDLKAIPRGKRAALKRARELMELTGQTPRRERTQPRTIEELLEQAAECGTHSILDIEHVAQRLGHGVAAPLSASQLERRFRTREPTHKQVEERWSDIAESLAPWQAYYFIVYHEHLPREYAFIGCSGD